MKVCFCAISFIFDLRRLLSKNVFGNNRVFVEEAVVVLSLSSVPFGFRIFRSDSECGLLFMMFILGSYLLNVVLLQIVFS
jgi:hypothetical protein